MTADDRAEYTAGLRALADLLDANPHLRLPWSGGPASELLVFPALADDHKKVCADWARALPGRVTKNVRDDRLDVIGNLRGIYVQVIADRDQVCTRVVTGTEEVTRQVPDPAVTVPMVEITETVEQVTWECGSLLAPVGGSA